MQAATPKNEVARLKALGEYQILDTPPEQAYDDITELAAYICKTPIALISLIDESRQWFKSRVGMALKQSPREDTFCAHALVQPEEMLLVRDTLGDPRFSDNRWVVGSPYMRFYAGVPLVTKAGEVLGMLCVIDTQPRELDTAAQSALFSLARQVMAQFELRKTLYTLQKAEQELVRLNRQLAEQTLIDPLTQMNNRRALELNLVAEWERAFRYSQPLSLLILDVDEFQAYSGKFGLQAGEGVLRQVAEIITHEARQTDFVARYGGEEFVVVLPETDSEGAMKVAERIRSRIESASWPHRPITVSVGQASYGNQANAEAFLAQAGQAMNRAKQAGRNRVMGSTL